MTSSLVPRRPRTIPALLAAMALALGAALAPGDPAEESAAAKAPSADAEPARPALRLAFLRADAARYPDGFFDRFADALAEEPIADGVDDALFDGAVVRLAPSAQELLGDMRAARCDVALGSPAILLAATSEGELWRVALQERRPGDAGDDRPGGQGTLRPCAIIASGGGPANADALARLAKAGRTIRVAFATPDSLEGFVAPRVYLAALGFGDASIEAWFAGSEEDVFLAVANGAAELGALGEAAFDRLLAEHEALAATEPRAAAATPRLAARTMSPAPPVCVSPALEKRLGSDGARELIEAMRRAAAKASGGELSLSRANRDRYAELLANARLWHAEAGPLARR